MILRTFDPIYIVGHALLKVYYSVMYQLLDRLSYDLTFSQLDLALPLIPAILSVSSYISSFYCM